MTPADSLTLLTTLFGVVVTIMVFVLAIVSWLIWHDGSGSSVASGPASELLGEPAGNAGGVAIIVILLLAGAIAAGQIIHWAWT